MKCKTCGTDHRGVVRHGGYCLDHQEQRANAAEAQLAQLEAERDMYKHGFDALTAVSDKIARERDEARCALVQHQQTRAELLDTIAQLKRENETQAKRIKELEDENDELTGFDSSFAAIALKNQNVGIRHTEYEGEYETPLGIALDGQGDEVEP